MRWSPAVVTRRPDGEAPCASTTLILGFGGLGIIGDNQPEKLNKETLELRT
jgi:hypothetical protein